jgi:transposase-like protein
MKIHETEFCGIECCEYCHEIIYTNFDCPICKTKNAKTSISGPVWELDDTFFCKECNEEFLYIDYDSVAHVKFTGNTPRLKWQVAYANH